VRAFLPGGTMPRKPIFGLLGWLFTYAVVGSSLVFFRANDTESVIAAVRALGDWGGPVPAAISEQPWQVWAIFVLGYASCLWPDAWNKRMFGGWKRLPVLAQGAVLALAMLFFLGVAPPGLAPFLYFQF
jgi:hypothetical protein